ncbi:EF-hand domain-containing protein [Asticcacaulis solisilvae]|uniref:EF-hand domain-containing protein n=1 Tax=Asticcacaulis solisilvae TaxID=1217274 RepID=UPI003FD84028
MIRLHPVAGIIGVGIAAAGFMALQACAQNAPPQPPMGRPAFEDVDTNHDGTISKAEFQAFLARMPAHAHGGPGPDQGPRDGHMHHMMPMDIKTLDKNGDGKISFEEFAAPMKAHFAELDANHDGFLEANELPQPPRDGGGMPPAPPPGK